MVTRSKMRIHIKPTRVSAVDAAGCTVADLARVTMLRNNDAARSSTRYFFIVGSEGSDFVLNHLRQMPAATR